METAKAAEKEAEKPKEKKLETPKVMAEEYEEKATERKKGFFSSIKDSVNKLRKKYWEDLGEEKGAEAEKKLQDLKERAEEAAEEFEEKSEEIVGKETVESKERELKNKLDRAREELTKARADHKKYEGITGSLKRLTRREAAKEADLEVRSAEEKYLEARAEFVGENVEKYINEKTELADAQAEAYQEKRGFGRKIYDAYKKMGEWNLTKLGVKPKSKWGKRLARAASVRTLVSGGLIAGGSAAAAAGAAGTAIGMFAARRMMGGAGAGIGSYDLMKMGADRKLAGDIPEIPEGVSERKRKKLEKKRDKMLREIDEMSNDDLRKRLEYYEAVAPMNGKKPSEIPYYEKLRNEYKQRLQAEMNEREAAKTEDRKPKTEMIDNAKNELMNQRAEEFKNDMMKYIKLQHIIDNKYFEEMKSHKKGTPEYDKWNEKVKEAEQKLESIKSGLPEDMQKQLDEFMLDQDWGRRKGRLESLDMTEGEIEAMAAEKPDEIDEELVMAEDWKFKSEIDENLEKMYMENESIQKEVEQGAIEILNQGAEIEEKNEAEKKAEAVQSKLAEMMKADLTEVEKRRKKAVKNDAIMKGIAVGIGAFVGSGGVSWLSKEMGFGEPKTETTDKQLERLGQKPQQPEIEVLEPSVEKAELGETMPELAESIEASTSVREGEGMLHGINRILKENPELKSELGGAKEIREWRLDQLKALGYDLSGRPWDAPFTLSEGDQVNIFRGADGSLQVELSPKGEAAVTPNRVAEWQAEAGRDLSPSELADRHSHAWDEHLKAYMRRAEAGTLTEDEMTMNHLKTFELTERDLKAQVEKSAEAKEAGELEFEGENVEGKVTVKETPSEIRTVVEGSVEGMGAKDLVNKGILAEDYREKLFNRFGDRANLQENAVLARARKMYLNEQALQKAQDRGNEKAVKSLKKTIDGLRKANKSRYPDIFA